MWCVFQKRELLLQTLHFTALLIEHSFSRHLYNSVEHLIQLLEASDMQVRQPIARESTCHAKILVPALWDLHHRRAFKPQRAKAALGTNCCKQVVNTGGPIQCTRSDTPKGHLLSLSPQVVLHVLNLIYMFSKRSNFISRLSSDRREALVVRLYHLAEVRPISHRREEWPGELWRHGGERLRRMGRLVCVLLCLIFTGSYGRHGR